MLTRSQSDFKPVGMSTEFEVNERVKIVVQETEFEGKIFVNIRKFFDDKPTRSGISLNKRFKDEELAVWQQALDYVAGM